MKNSPNKITAILFILMLIVLIFASSCSKDEEEVLVPLFEISLDGDSFDPYERYSVVSTFGGTKYIDNVVKKIFILYVQVDDGDPRLDRQHFAMYVLDTDANDDGELLDVGTYTWENPDNKYAGVEIPGPDDYVIWNKVEVLDAGQLGGPHSGLICLTVEGEFFNPYVNAPMTVSIRLENFPIGQDIDATPYGFLLD